MVDLLSRQILTKQGVWVWDEQYKEWLCDNCKYPLPNQFGFDDKKWRPKVNFCPHCGADMRGDDNES